MKTKHLLAAIMLPALFAACTNDEFESVSQNAETVNGRKLADNVTLSFSMEDNANTRLAYGSNGYTWQKNDTIGACLMDNITPDYNTYGKTWSERFSLTDYIQTNYKFTRDADGAWKTEAKLCEGNYFFCYPYNANMGVRNAYTFSVKSQAMTNTTTAALQEAYAKNNAFVGFSKVEAGNGQGESLGIDMVSVFGATGFTLKNTGTNTYKIEKIVLRGDKVVNSAKINPTNCNTNNVQYNSDNANQTFNVANYVGDDKDKQYNKEIENPTSTYDKNKALRGVLNYGEEPSSVEVTLAAGNVVKTQKSINVIAMVAEKEISEGQGEAVLDIYTDKGMIRGIDLSKRNTNTEGGSAQNVLTDVALESIGSGNKVEITFDDTSVDVPNELVITSSEDLASLIHWNAKVPTPITAKLKGNVTVTKEMYNELASSKIGVATIKNVREKEEVVTGQNENGDEIKEMVQPMVTVTLAADVPAGALDRFTYSGNVKVNVKGTQTLAKNHVAAASEDKTSVTVAIDKGAVLNVNSDAAVARVENNKGTLNVNATLTAATTNKSVMNIAVGKMVTNLTNLGTVTNKGKIASLTNKEVKRNQPSAITNEGNIVNGTNAGTITNNAGEVVLTENEGTIYANNKSATDVTTNTGSIVITKLESDGNYKAGGNGAIVQQLATASTTEVDKRANTVWLTGALSVEPKKDKDGNLVEIDLSTITIYAKSSAARIDGNGKEQTLKLNGIKVGEASALVVNNVTIDLSNKIEIEGNEEDKKYATLTINANAAYTNDSMIPTESDLGGYDILKNYGSVKTSEAAGN